MIESLEISLKSFESKLLQTAVDQIFSSLSPYVLYSKENVSQISFPQKQKRLTILRSPHVHKKSREQFRVQSYKTMIRFSLKNFQDSEYPLLHSEFSLFFENLKYLKLLGVQMKVQICYTTFLQPKNF